MRRALLIGALLLASHGALAQRVISDYPAASSINLTDKLLIQQGPRTTPYTYGTPGQILGAGFPATLSSLTVTGNSSLFNIIGADTSPSTFPFVIKNSAATTLFFVANDGGVMVGNPTGGSQGLGTINVSSGFFTSAATGNYLTGPLGSIGRIAANNSAGFFLGATSSFFSVGTLLTENLQAIVMNGPSDNNVILGHGTYGVSLGNQNNNVIFNVPDCGGPCQGFVYATASTGQSSGNVYGKISSAGTGPITNLHIDCASVLPNACSIFFDIATTGVSPLVLTAATGSTMATGLVATSQATGTNPTFGPQGTDSNIGMNFLTKGSGTLQINGTNAADCTLTTVSHLTVVKGIVTLCN